MELILKQDVDRVGFADDIVSVKPGYGRNFLIPQGLAKLATPSAVKDLNEKLKQKAFKEAKLIEEANAKADQLKAIETKISAKKGAGNKLFGSVTNADLAKSLEKSGVAIDKKFIQIIGGTVKSIGTYTAKIRFHRDVIASYNFDVVALVEAKKEKK